MAEMAASETRQQKADWHHEDIKAAVRKTGVSFSELAIRHGLSPSAAHKVLTRPSRQLQQLIADHLGLTPQKIWPSRYDELGQFIDRRRVEHATNSRKRPRAQRQNRGNV